MKDILLIQLARFGDLVQTGRLIKSLEMLGRVHLCVDVSLKELAACLYPHAIVHTVPAHNGAHTQAEHVQQMYHTCKVLQESHFCSVYNLNYSPLNITLARLFPAEIVSGYAVQDGQVLRSPWVHKAFAWTQKRNISPINLVDFWAHFTAKPCPPSDVHPLAKGQAKGQGKGIGIVLAGRESRRSLPPAVLAPVIRIFFESLGGPKVYLLGSSAEMPLARQIKKLLPAAVQQQTEDYCGKTSWQGLMDAVQGLDALISPDTGTMHLGARLGVPVHAFFLSSAWCHETGPYGAGHTVWQSLASCAPCLESRPCTIGTSCLQDYSHPLFFRALTAHIQKRALPMTQDGKDLPSSLSCQTSYIDALGTAWRVQHGQDPHEKQRLALRAVVAEYCHCPLKESPIDSHMAQYFYDEADWMLRERKNSLYISAREMK